MSSISANRTSGMRSITCRLNYLCRQQGLSGDMLRVRIYPNFFRAMMGMVSGQILQQQLYLEDTSSLRYQL